MKSARRIQGLLVSIMVAAGCAGQETEIARPAERLVEVVQKDVPADRYCDTGMLPGQDLAVLEFEHGRITPADQNGFLDTTALLLTDDARDASDIVIQRAGSCDNRRTIPIPSGADSVGWDGRTDVGEFADPGSYYVQVADAAGRSVALARMVVGVEDDVCALRASDKIPLFENRYAFDELRIRDDVEVVIPERGHVCLSVDKLDGRQMVPYIGIDNVPVVSHMTFTIDTTSLSVSKPVGAEKLLLRVGGTGGSFRLSLDLIPDNSVPPQASSAANANYPGVLTCRGRLQSYPHPFGVDRTEWLGEDGVQRFTEGRRPVAREGVRVRCAAVFRYKAPPDDDPTYSYAFRKAPDGWHPDVSALYPRIVAASSETGGSGAIAMDLNQGDVRFLPGFGGIPTLPGLWDDYPGLDIPLPPPDLDELVGFSNIGVTNATGAYEIPVFIGPVPEDYEFVSLSASCSEPFDCKGGYDSSYTADIDYEGFIDVKDVADMQFGRRHIRLITNAGQHPVEKGQFRLPTLTESIVVENAAAMEDAIGAQPSIASDGIFLPEEMNDLPVVIHEAFDPLDEDSFDYMIWILGGQPVSFLNFETPDRDDYIDNPDACQLPRANLCYGFAAGRECKWQPDCDAFSSPVQCYQKNVLKPLLEAGYDIWLVDHGMKATTTEVARRSPHMYQEILRHPYPDEDRPIAVSGLSGGGVTARIALTLWERKDEVAQIVADNDLQLVRLDDPQLLTEDAERVEAYFSFDSPHRGAIVPVAMQAYLQDPDMPDTSTLVDLIGSEEAKELTRNYVDPDINMPCPAVLPANCQVRRETPELRQYIDELRVQNPELADKIQFEIVPSTRISSARSDQLIRESIEILGAGHDPDGLPVYPRSFALANSWRVGPGPSFNSPEFLNARVRIDAGPETATFVHRLTDSAQQPRGSTQPLFCKAYGIANPDPVHIAAAAFGVCMSHTDGGLAGAVFCGVGGILTDVFGSLFGSKRYREVDVKVDVPMRFATFMPTESAMNVGSSRAEIGTHAPGFEDVLWHRSVPGGPGGPPVHTDVTEDACKFIRYHLDGTMKGDRDGVPSCRANMLSSCAAGGMAPGDAVDPAGSYEAAPGEFCDCDETTANIFASNACAIKMLPSTVNKAERN